MNRQKRTASNPKNASATPQTPAQTALATAQSSAPFFRSIDWLTFLVTFLCVWVGYCLTLAPEVTLEDSGELATGSFYAGIPHPPGYPVWTIYTWLWTVLIPIKNVAWRVALGEATGGAVAAGLLGMLVSRGGSLLISGIEELKSISVGWERGICLISGFGAGMLMGFNGFMWSQSVIVEVYSFSVASLMLVLLCLLRWIYAPHHRRYLCLALFFHGICFTNHQTLIVAAIGIEFAIAAANFRIGRELWLGNSILYLGGLILNAEGILTVLESNVAVFVIFHIVGICSILLYLWFSFLSRTRLLEFGCNFFWTALWLALASGPALSAALGWFLTAVIFLSFLAGFTYCAGKTWKLGQEWLLVIICGFCWLAGAAFYFYMPLAGMTNPPMEWGYPRTVEGFFHAFTRGQYEKTNPTNIFHDPMRFVTQLSMLGTGIIEEFNWLYAFLALLPFLFFFKLHRRERAWLIGLTSIYLCLGVLLLILLNPPPDRAAQELVRVFFTASHTVIALLIGYGITLVCAYMATHYLSFRFWGLTGGAVAIGLALLSFTELTHNTFFGENAPLNMQQLLTLVGQAFTNKDQYGLPIFAGLILVGMAFVFVLALWTYQARAPLTIILGLFALMPVHSILTHWSDNEQHNHWFGYWFGHDMFSPPFTGADNKTLYPEMSRNAIIFGGTDPGRFCPTYMIFCDSFIPHHCQPEQDRKFDRRDAYLITQNALADGTYLCYIRAQYSRSAQVDPPFFQELLRSDKERQEHRTNFVARLVQPLDTFFARLGARIEKRRRTCTSWFKPSDFTDLDGLLAKLRANPQQDSVSSYLYQQLSPKTQNLLASNANRAELADRLAADLNRVLEQDLASTKPNKSAAAHVEPLFSPQRFKDIALSDYVRDFITQNPQGDTRIRLNRLLLEAAYPGAIAKTPGGVYPDREIYTPSPADSARCYNEYMLDAQRRFQLNQLKPGEDVKYDADSSKVQISGQVAVMSINALLAKVIFEHNPKNEFYVEESFPLDWMYPYLKPYGIIMKMNREPLTGLTEEMVRTDHEFWSRYSERLIGNWITYDTDVKTITDWIEQVFLRRNFRGFTGDRRFIRDDQAQKAFSKLRDSIGGVYNWRLGTSKPGTPEHQRMLKEADFAFRQAFAFCPYSPEAVFRYATFLTTPEVHRLDDALLIARTCQKLDPFNAGILDLVRRLEDWKSQRAGLNPAQLEKQVELNPDDFQAAFNLASTYLQLGQANRAVQLLDGLLNNPRANTPVLRALLQAFTSLNNTSQIQATLDKLASRFHANPPDLAAGVALAENYRAQQKPDLATQTLDEIARDSNLDPNTAFEMAQQFAAMSDYPRLEAILERLVKLAPESAESWYDLAAMKNILGKPSEALTALRQALKLSAVRIAKDPKAKDLLRELPTDPRFNSLRRNPEFQELARGSAAKR